MVDQNMSSSLPSININVPFNGKYFLLKAIVCSASLFTLLVLLSLVWKSESSPYEFAGFIISVTILAVFSAHFCSRYIGSKRHFLNINEEQISWVNQHKKAKVNWSFITEVNIVDLSEKVGRSKYVVYDFVLDARESMLPSPMTLYAVDYQISHPELLELIEQAAKHYSFKVILNRS
jgi:hypothetical protein